MVREATGHVLAYVYFEGELDRRSAADLLTRDEFRRIAANVAKGPGLPAPKLLTRPPWVLDSIPNASSTRRQRAAAWRPS